MESTIGEHKGERGVDSAESAAQRQELHGDALSFVVQKHAARNPHYDLHLEVGGALKSWEIPQGFSLDPKEKRQAIAVEDHPPEYGRFEGVIPEGQAGSGEVIIWDEGIYSPDESGELMFNDRAEAERRAQEGLARGKLSLFLWGSKLVGAWGLVRMPGEGRDWLLFKHQDEFARFDYDPLSDDRSAVSGATVEDLRAGSRQVPGWPRRTQEPKIDAPVASPAPFPDTAEPMLASPAAAPFSSPCWLFEPKLDGVRALALVRDGDVRLLSPRGLDIASHYPGIVRQLARYPQEMVLDGEIVALDAEGRPSFQLLRQRLNLTGDEETRRAEQEFPIVYHVFDLLYLDGYDLRRMPLEYRKAILGSMILPSDRVRVLDHFDEDGEIAFEASVSMGLEGIVAKRRESSYESGQRSRDWLKIKATQSGDFVIGGFTEGTGARFGRLGALVAGMYSAGRLVYVGHVGTGFDRQTLAELRQRLDALRSPRCPFAEMPPLTTPTIWVRPQLVAKVRFAQWTAHRQLRSPVFLRLRPDEPAAGAIREEVATPPPVQKGDATGHEAADLQGVLEQLKQCRDQIVLRVNGHRLPVTNLDKQLWPASREGPAVTKRI